MLKLDSPISEFEGVGPKLNKLLSLKGIFSIKDLLYFFPRRYVDFSQILKLSEAKLGQIGTFAGKLSSIKSRYAFKSRISLAEAIFSDGSASIKVVWFNQPYLAKQFEKNPLVYISGKIEAYKGLQISNPVYEFQNSGAQIHTGRLVPVYPYSAEISPRQLRKIISQALPMASQCEEFLTLEQMQNFGLINVVEAIHNLHFPSSLNQVEEGMLKISFDELLPQQIALQKIQQKISHKNFFKIKIDVGGVKSLTEKLPFELTNGQKRAIWDILQDMSKPGAMNRLVQGDVGSGKTIVALIAAEHITRHGWQSAIIAPTELLALQHFETFKKFLGSNFGIALLSRSFAFFKDKKLTPKELAEIIATNQAKIVIGTHAIFNAKIKFANLALTVIDEQHRFGVSQRQALQIKAKKMPHLLSLSATPIPRSLALSLYGNLDISIIAARPAERKRVITSVIDDSSRAKLYEFIRDEAARGRQAFIVTPRVEQSSASETKSAKKEFELLTKTEFKNLNCALIYGSMKGSEKDQILSDMAAGKIDVLIATSVIEIGIDIPNASIIAIEGAENFGLAQLHQLRGRVGRSDIQSYCFLLTTNNIENERLSFFAKNHDGFELAKTDMENRGFGDLLGKNQTGYSFKYPQFISLKAFEIAANAAKKLFKSKQKLPLSLEELSQQYLENFHGE